jgi:plastocyanin
VPANRRAGETAARSWVTAPWAGLASRPWNSAGTAPQRASCSCLFLRAVTTPSKEARSPCHGDALWAVSRRTPHPWAGRDVETLGCAGLRSSCSHLSTGVLAPLQEPALFPLPFLSPISLLVVAFSVCVFTHFCSPFFFIPQLSLLTSRDSPRHPDLILFDRRFFLRILLQHILAGDNNKTQETIFKMKYSAALALGVAHLAFGKSVQKVAPREPNGSVTVNGQLASQIELSELQRLFGFSASTGFEINVLWVNVGGGAATTVINQAQTVTVTQTVVGGAAETLAGLPPVGAPPVAAPPVGAPPAAGAPGEVAATPTDVAVANPVVGATGATHSVTVGGPQGLAFNPPQLAATPGDTVIFTFLSQNHTATQSAFETPCDPLAGGMDSGFQSNPNNTVNPPPQVAMQVMVSTPLCKLNPLGNAESRAASNIEPRVLLPPEQPLRQGHDLLHQPHCR